MVLPERWKRRLCRKLSPRLAEEVLTAKAQEMVQVIIEFPALRSCSTARIKELIHQAGGKVIYELPLINSLAVELPAERLAEIIPSVHAKMVWPDVQACPCLDVAVPAVGADLAHQQGLTGKGIVIAVVDTGIDPHPDLTKPTSRIVGWHDLVNGRSKPYDDEGHGTHVAGIIAGNGYQENGKYTGIAPEALLVGVKVLDKMGSGPISRVIAGIQWVVDNKEKYRIKAINLSLGAPPEQGYRTDPASKAVNAAWKAGLLVCAAAGNSGPGRWTITTPGISPLIITVGSIDDQGTVPRTDDAISDFSSRGPTIDFLTKPDLVAPGARITSLKPGGGYIESSGTSMATPVVTGAAALLWQKDPDLTPDQIKKLLMATAEDRGYNRQIQGAGYLNLSTALASLDKKLAPQSNETQEDLAFALIMAVGLKYADGEKKEELLTLLSNHLSDWLRKTGRFPHQDPVFYQEHLPAFFRGLGEWMLRENKTKTS